MKTLFKFTKRRNYPTNLVKEFIRVYLVVLLCGAAASLLTGCTMIINSEQVYVTSAQEGLLELASDTTTEE